MKKTVWIILPIVIIAVVLVAVFAGQRNSLNDQLVSMESEKQELTRQLSEADMAAKTAQELAENDIATARQQVEEAAAALSAMTSERDALQAKSEELQVKNDTAAQQLNDSIRQAQIALDALIGEEAGPEKELAAAKVQLEETQAELDAVKTEIAAYQEAAAADQNALEAAKAEAEQAKAALAQAEADTAAQIEAAVAAALAEVKTETVRVTLTQEGAEEPVLTLDSLSELAASEVAPGAYTLTLAVLDADGAEAFQYAFPYVITGPAEEAAPMEEAPAEEAPVEETKPTEEAPAEEAKPAEETPAGEAKPAEEAAPVEEAKPAEEAPAEETKPAEEAAPAEEAPTEEAQPTQDAA